MLVLFALVLARVGGLFLGAPVLSTPGMPQRVKAMIVLLLAVAIAPSVPTTTLPEGGYAVAVAMVSEIAVGFAFGLLGRLFLGAFQLAGSLVAFQMGFGMAQAFDETSGVESTLIATMYLQMVTLLFLILDGHHLLIRSVVASYEAFPLGATLATGVLSESVFAAGSTMFEAGARISGPVTGLMLLINALMGLLNRIVPQISIFNIGFPLTVMAGLVAILLSVPEMVSFFLSSYGSFEHQLVELLG